MLQGILSQLRAGKSLSSITQTVWKRLGTKAAVKINGCALTGMGKFRRA